MKRALLKWLISRAHDERRRPGTWLGRQVHGSEALGAFTSDLDRLGSGLSRADDGGLAPDALLMRGRVCAAIREADSRGRRIGDVNSPVGTIAAQVLRRWLGTALAACALAAAVVAPVQFTRQRPGDAPSGGGSPTAAFIGIASLTQRFAAAPSKPEQALRREAARLEADAQAAARAVLANLPFRWNGPDLVQ